MKNIRSKFVAFGASLLIATAFTSCEENDLFSIDAPDDLQARIDAAADAVVEKQRIADSIAAAKVAAFEARFTDDVYQVGNTDNSSGFWSAHSKYYVIAPNDTSYVRLKNFSSGKKVYQGWFVAVTNTLRGGDGYVEYAIVRPDNFSNWSWGNENGVGYNTSDDTGKDQSARLVTNYTTNMEDSDAAFITAMNGATCDVQVQRSGDTIKFVFDITPLSGSKMNKSFYVVEPRSKGQDIYMFFGNELSHQVFFKTLLSPSDAHIPDFELDANWSSGTVEEIIPEPTTPTPSQSIVTKSDVIFSADATEQEYYSEATLKTTDEVQVGADDNSTGWFAAFSPYYRVNKGQTLKIVADVKGGANVWSNIVTFITDTIRRGADGYSEYCFIRLDNWGDGALWKDSDPANRDFSQLWTNASVVQHIDNGACADWLAGLIDLMKDAEVAIDITHDADGVKLEIVIDSNVDGYTADPITLTGTFNAVESNAIHTFFVCDGSHFVVKSATWE